MKNLVILFFFLFGIILSNAQTVNYEQQLGQYFEKLDTFVYTNQDSTFHYADKVIVLAIENNDIETVLGGYSYATRSAGHFYNFDKMKSNFKALDSLLLVKKNDIAKLPDALYYVNSIHYDQGAYFFELNDYLKSRKQFNEIITATERLPDSMIDVYNVSLLSGSFSFIAKMYSNEGKFELAKQYYFKNIRLLKEKNPTDLASLYRNYSLLAEVYEREGKYAISNDYFVKSLNFNLHNQGNSNRIISESYHLIENHLKLSQSDSASFYLRLLKEHLPEGHALTDKYHQAKAEIFKNHKNYDSAFVEFGHALTFSKNKWNQQKHNEVAMLYNDIGQLQVDFKKPRQAIETYNLSIDQLSKNSSVNQSTLVKVFKNKAHALNLLQTENKFSEALKTVDLGIQTLDSLKPTFQDNLDKSLFVEDAFPLFEAGIVAAYELYEKTKEDSYINKAFTYFEKSKNVLLFEALLSTKASKYGGIPESVLDKEKQLKAELIYIETKFSETKE